MRILLFSTSCLFLFTGICSQVKQELSAFGCYAVRSGDHFILGNQNIERCFSWNSGQLITESLLDKTRDTSILFSDTVPDLYIPGETMVSSEGRVEMVVKEKSPKWENHLEVVVYSKLNDLEVKRIFRVFPYTPAIQCRFYFRGSTGSDWIKGIAEEGEHLNKIQPFSDGREGYAFAPVMERIDLPGRHWKIKTVRFFDVTDRYNPSADKSYAFWEKDAEAIAGFYKRYGITTVKVDGLKMEDKQSEINIRKMLDRGYDVSERLMKYNLDVTAHVRFGYHYFNEYGVYWATNRYTDWLNYYPYQVLRNTWMLSRYYPPEKLQMPFLNIWRNADKYGDDPFAPSQVPFEYAFAVTLASQPMAFFECSGLPEEAFEISPVVSEYLEIQPDLHSGMIFPVGEEPSGSSWTGFQSIKNEYEGYLIVYRELNEQEEAGLETWLPEGEWYFEKVLGHGEIPDQQVKNDGVVRVQMPGQNSWGIFKYYTAR